ncbi:hypothetical protein E8F20_27550 [Pseudomonas sp. BN415]|uniref:DUF7696 family protein n=1 Tax=Pseudomonas sp. BN415 TaxID=2567889 RepID=UPI002454FEE0|nr:hypothetical protein [Pseudomonas sp. BN415]MDH4585607.1 hypothetical protein [Pseudomonas sp. BN415]
MTDQTERQHMLECEARYWLRRGNTTPEKITELEKSLARRGAAAVERLIEEMRRQWTRRQEWLGGGNGGQ